MLATVRFSNCDWALISRNSSSTSSWSAERPRSRESTRRASSSRPWVASQRGEKGMKIMPTKRITAGPSCRQMGISQELSYCGLRARAADVVGAAVALRVRTNEDNTLTWKACPPLGTAGEGSGSSLVDPEADHDAKRDGQLPA